MSSDSKSAEHDSTARQPAAVALLGGTFDPIHFGHLRCAWELKERIGLDKVHLIPCHHPTHRSLPETPSQHRLAMVQLAVADSPGLIADDREIRRNTPSYSIDTVASLRQELGPETVLILAMGTDAFASLTTWHQWQQLFDLCHIVVMMRPGASLPESGLESDLLDLRKVTTIAQLKARPCGHILPLPVTALDIAATAIREQVAAGYEPRYLLPSSVWRYICEHQLYKS